MKFSRCPNQFRSVFFFSPHQPLFSLRSQRSLFFCHPLPLQFGVMEAPAVKGLQHAQK